MFIEESKFIIIAFVPRSGSNYLCDMIHRVGGMGCMIEYYFPYDFKERVEYWDKSLIEFERIDKTHISDEISWFSKIVCKGGLKCTWAAHEQLLIESKELLKSLDVKYIYLHRHDKLRQAISWYRASYNSQWTSKHQIKQDPPYNKSQIKQYLEWIDLDEARWEAFFKNKEYLELYYEDINYETLKLIENYTNTKRHRDREIESEYTILRDDITEKWVEAYMNDQNFIKP